MTKDTNNPVLVGALIQLHKNEHRLNDDQLRFVRKAAEKLDELNATFTSTERHFIETIYVEVFGDD